MFVFVFVFVFVCPYVCVCVRVFVFESITNIQTYHLIVYLSHKHKQLACLCLRCITTCYVRVHQNRCIAYQKKIGEKKKTGGKKKGEKKRGESHIDTFVLCVCAPSTCAYTQFVC